MIHVKEFNDYLKKIGVGFYTGVPDSQLSSFCDFIEYKYGISDKHIITPNEGNAVALASGYHLATGKYPLVYMQNSGIGNAVNPISSLTDVELYKIPIIYLIGWRGEPGVHDEPQHKKQGKITPKLIELLGIDYEIITKDTKIEDIKSKFETRFKKQLENGKSIAFIISKGAFKEFKKEKSNENTISREIAIQTVLNHLTEKDIVISTTGKASREVFEYRETTKAGHDNDFLTVGSMGHSSSIALGIAINKKDKEIFCFDGDGAVLMHMGSLAMIGSKKPKNFHHILFNNGAHESVGGLATIMPKIDIEKLAISCGYHKTYSVKTISELEKILPEFINEEGPVLLNIEVNLDSRKDLGRPTTSPEENKLNFMKKLKE